MKREKLLNTMVVMARIFRDVFWMACLSLFSGLFVYFVLGRGFL